MTRRDSAEQGPEGEHRAVCLLVKIVPGASRTRLMGMLDGRLKIAVSAAAEKGKANAELIAFLASKLGVRRRDVTITRGHTSPLKQVRIANAPADRIRSALGWTGTDTDQADRA